MLYTLYLLQLYCLFTVVIYALPSFVGHLSKGDKAEPVHIVCFGRLLGEDFVATLLELMS